jgi:integrase
VLATTGARRGEILGLRWKDLDLTRGRASFVQTVMAVKHELVVGNAPKTMAGERTVSLDTDTVVVLKSWKAHQAAERLRLGGGYRDHDLVFPKVNGEPLHPERVSREFDRRVQRWSLPKLTCMGSDTPGPLLPWRAASTRVVVQKRLGHSTISTTLDLYTHATQVMDAEAAATVAGKVLGGR